MIRSTRGLEIINGQYHLFGTTVERFDDETLCFTSDEEKLLVLADPSSTCADLLGFIDELFRRGYNLGNLRVCMGERTVLELLFDGSLTDVQPTPQDGSGVVWLQRVTLGNYVVDVCVRPGLQSYAMAY